MRPVKKFDELTLADRLSNLDHEAACKLLGASGARSLAEARRTHAINDVKLSARVLRVRFDDAEVSARLDLARKHRLDLKCSACPDRCPHIAAALSLVLEEKTSLGLAAPPDLEPIEQLDEPELVDRALAERAERARVEPMRVRSSSPGKPWTDYTVTSAASGRSYRVALRGEERGISYCSCPDYRKNTLGTCKHILHVLAKVKKRYPAAQRRRPPYRRDVSVHLRYAESIELRVSLPTRGSAEAREILGPLAGGSIDDPRDLVSRIAALEQRGITVNVYPDAEELINLRLRREHLRRIAREIRAAPADHPLRAELLAVELRPYQLDGIGFAIGAGRSILADDMGLGKTIQAIGVAELLAKEVGINRVLVVCPASVKSQWQAEIARFSGRSTQLVAGAAADRPEQYGAAFFTICNYEQVLRDIQLIGESDWDLIVLDEAQRIKNWEAKTSRTIKRLRSSFALALTGTPIENRLDDLYSIMEFVDERRLGPAFRFFSHHRELDADGRLVGYRNLDEVRSKLAPVLLRRTRDEVLGELPPRTTQIMRIAPTAEQLELHDSNMRVVGQIANKKFISEMDLLRLRKALLMARLAANGTFLVDKKQPGFSSKLEALAELIGELLADPARKIVLFSEWTSMLDRVEQVIATTGADHVRLDGSVPQQKRRELVDRFRRDAGCRLFLTTNAGSTGLNLQAADTVINVDLPWNPAVLEQRIARAHRMGQARPVQVFILVSETTIEENMLATLSAKHQLALATLTADSEVDRVQIESALDELKRRLEVLLGARPEAPIAAAELVDTEKRSADLDRRRRVEIAGGELLGAAFKLLGELVPDPADDRATRRVSDEIREGLEACVNSERGRQTLTVELPNTVSLDQVARSLARLVAASQGASALH